MYNKQEIIIRYHREGKSIRSISRELSISRKTVSKYVSSYEASLLSSSCRSTAQVDWLNTAPCYHLSSRPKIRLTQEVQSEIDHYLSLNEEKRQHGQGKQCLKKCDILSLLHQKGYQLGYTTLCNYIRSKSVSITPEVFIRQSAQRGQDSEFDWGEIKLYIDGQLRRVYIGVFTSCFSNTRYAMLFWRQDTLSFMECHVSYFSYCQGVYHRLVYDNMRVAVARFVGPHEKEPTRALTELKSHYGFSHRFCNARRGNEKGHVERSIEYVRRKAFSVHDHFPDLESANSHLLSILSELNKTKQQLTGSSADELFEQERELLYPLPSSPLSCFEYTQLRVDKYATVSYHTNRYSVPEQLVGRFVEIKVYSNYIEIWQGNQLIATHTHCYGKHQWMVDIEHYLVTLCRKPGALCGSTALNQNVYLKQLYDTHFQDCPKDFIELLHYCHKHKTEPEKLEASVERLLNNVPQRISCEKITALLGNISPINTVVNDTTSDSEIHRNSISQLQQITYLLENQTLCNPN